MRCTWLAVAVMIVMIATVCKADVITGSSTGLTNPNTVLTFDGGPGLADKAIVTSYFGVNFSGFGWDNSDLGQNFSTGFSGGDLVNGFFGWPGDTTMTISFNTVVTGAAFAAVGQNSPFVVKAFLGGAQGTLVDTLNISMASNPGVGYIGFNNESFDTLVIANNGTPGSSAFSIDNLQIIGPINLGVCCSTPAPDTSGGPGPGPGPGSENNGGVDPPLANQVPEPSSMILLGSALSALPFLSRKKRFA